MKPLKLKICGMREPENMKGVAALRPDYMGFIFYPGSKRFVAQLPVEALAALPTNIKKTGVFVNQHLEEVISYVNQYQLDAVQLHGAEDPAFCAMLKKSLSGVEIIKAFGVGTNFNFDLLDKYVGQVDYFLFDTQTPEHGGSGELFDWSILQHYQLEVPFFLSGGIGPGSVEALKELEYKQLYAIDVNSKFELAPGLKDIGLLTTFKHQLFLSPGN